MKATNPNARRVRRGACVMFRTIFGSTTIGLVHKRRGEHVEIHYGAGNEAVMYLEDVFGVVSKKHLQQPSKEKTK